MPERIMPGLGLRAFYDPGQQNWGANVSEDLRLLSAMVQARAISRATTLPVTGIAGDIYLVPAGAPTDANAVAIWDGAVGAEAWVFIIPQTRWQVWIADEVRHVRFDGAAWADVPRPGVVPLRSLAVTAYELVLADTGTIIETTGASVVTITIPAQATVPFEIGTLINVTQVGAGVATITAAPGVALNGVAGGSTTLSAQWAGAALYKSGADAWIVQGAIGAVA